MSAKILIAYFTHSGNTRTVAEIIHELTNGHLFPISPVDAYPSDYDTVVDIARKEQRSNLRPTLTSAVENLVEIQTIILGYPNWWNTMPMPVFTFLEQYDFNGKTILPYCTHEGSRMGISEQDIRRVCKGATVLPGLPIRGSQVRVAKNELSNWLRNSGVIG
jgi:flavodoxin